jgi:hypothetical protein
MKSGAGKTTWHQSDKELTIRVFEPSFLNRVFDGIPSARGRAERGNFKRNLVVGCLSWLVKIDSLPTTRPR